MPTAGGLLFVAATKDGVFRVFDGKTGKLRGETELPASGFAAPSTDQIGGRQFVVAARDGAKWGTKSDDGYIAFALTDKRQIDREAQPRDPNWP